MTGNRMLPVADVLASVGGITGPIMNTVQRDGYYDALLKDMRANGQRRPVAILERGLVDGYHRLLVAVDLGWTHILACDSLIDSGTYEDWQGPGTVAS